MNQRNFEEMKKLELDLLQLLEEAVQNNEYIEDEIGEQVAHLHKKWLEFTWDSYSTQKHRAFVQKYVTDTTYKSYYDKHINGCAEFLKCAVEYHMV